MTKNPLWLKLIIYWVDTKRRTGLSLPFIIGARNEITESLEKKYKEHLQEELYSLNWFKWDKFSPNDLELIKAAIESS